VAENLLGAGANLEATDSKGNTPLHYAAGYGRGDFVKRLLAAGALGTAVNESGRKPLQLVTCAAVRRPVARPLCRRRCLPPLSEFCRFWGPPRLSLLGSDFCALVCTPAGWSIYGFV